VIERYLRELRALLPVLSRRRVLEEVEEHLRLAARDVGEEEAVARFGSPAVVARSFRARARWSNAALVLAAAVAFPVLTYPVSENQLPPAPWPSADAMPAELAWKRDAIIWLFVAAALAAAVALAGFARLRRLVVPAAAISLALLVATGALGTVLSVQWRDHVAAPAGLLLLGPLQIAVALGGLALLERARRAV
jgi:hypothetical protein